MAITPEPIPANQVKQPDVQSPIDAQSLRKNSENEQTEKPINQSSPICFVAQPFGDPDTFEQDYFTHLYEQVLRPAVEGAGLLIRRGDSYGNGNIMTTVVSAIAKAKIMIADITTLNPNVIYELAVRHALHRTGTIMIFNRRRSRDSIPFNLSNYRMIEFDHTSESQGYGFLQAQLRSFILDNPENSRNQPDNPVYQALPDLVVSFSPPNIEVGVSDDVRVSLMQLRHLVDVVVTNLVPPSDIQLSGEEGLLQTQLSQSQEIVRRYQEKYGELSEQSAKTPREIANEAAQAASEGHLPNLIMDEARRTVEALDTQKFIAVVQNALELTTITLTAEQFYDLATYSQRFDLSNLTSAIYERACTLYPSNSRLQRARMSFNSRSTDSTIRHQAQQDILNYLHISFVDGKVVVPEVEGSAVEVSMVGTLLDSYNGENEIDKAMQVIEAFYQHFPKRTLVVRNYGRQLEYLGRRNEALDYYRQALWCPDVNDTTAIWLGVELYNRQRYVDSAEAFCLAAILDATDANGFVQTADAITQAMINEQRANSLQQSYPHRRLPAGIDDTAVAVLLMSAVSCELLSQENVDLAAAVGARVGIDWARIMKVRSEGQSYTFKDHTMSERLDMNTRMQNVQAIYEKLRSPVTERPKKGA
jgi:tetratricopeptide (TPR) repeat protein